MMNHHLAHSNQLASLVENHQKLSILYHQHEEQQQGPEEECELGLNSKSHEEVEDSSDDSNTHRSLIVNSNELQSKLGLQEAIAFDELSTHHHHQQQQDQHLQHQNQHQHHQHQKDFDEVKQVELFGVSIVALTINSKERLCLAQISNTLLKEFSYNEIHNRRVALGITCVQCTPIQLEMLRRAGAMPSSSRRCGMITRREAERLCRSFLVEEQPPELPENFHFSVAHRVNYGCKGRFVPARYISSRAKCIECFYCGDFFSPNKFIFHSHRQPHATDCNPPDSPNINSWRKHIDLDWSLEHSQDIKYAWEDVKSLFNGGTRRRAPNWPSDSTATSSSETHNTNSQGKGTEKIKANSSKPTINAAISDELIDVVCDNDESGGNCPRDGIDLKVSTIKKQRLTSSKLWSYASSANNTTGNHQHSTTATTTAVLYPTSTNKAPINNNSNSSSKRNASSLATQQGNNKQSAAIRQPGGGGSMLESARPPLYQTPAQPISFCEIPTQPIQQQQHVVALNNNGGSPLVGGSAIGYPATNFIYNQLYSQLIQPQQAASHLWSTLLANLHSQKFGRGM